MSLIRNLLTVSLVSLLVLGCLEEGKPSTGTGQTGTDEPQPDPPAGATDFVSADGYQGQASPEDDMDRGMAAEEGAAEPAADGAAGGGEASVEEGDIYRVLGDGRILNFNSFRGLQVIDVSDPNAPSIIGGLKVTGSPVELYVFEDTAILLLNGWRGYYGARGDVRPGQWEGGLVVAVDISDATKPKTLGMAPIDGWIRKSRLVRNNIDAALYVVSQQYGEFENEEGMMEWSSRTLVRSLSLEDDGSLEEVSRIDLGGYVNDIQATTEVLMVASTDWTEDGNRSNVALIDIGTVDGTMRQGASVQVAGWIRNQFNMDFRDDTLRVVSGGRWRGSNTNHIQTFDATDRDHVEAIDHDTFGDGQNLFATLFMDNKAFCVTYLRQDPFHAFSIDDAGNIEEKNEYIISGWNDFFRSVEGGDRLIGIGVNDEDRTRTLAVSLYDITDLANPDPFIDRSEVDMSHSWSEANWDHRAFSVLAGVVDVQSPDGQQETGMVLLPFQGWDREAETHLAGVQIFTFSRDSLTRRGVMEHGTPVRRSFQVTDNTPANLSEQELSLFDTENPDVPAELGRLELAPNYVDLLPIGESHAIRLKDTSAHWGWWYRNQAEPPPAHAEIISLDGDPDRAEPVAVIEVPSGARLYKVGASKIATVHGRWNNEAQQDEPRLDVSVQGWDLSDIRNPVAGEVLQTRMHHSYGYWGHPALAMDMWYPWWGWGGVAIDTRATDDRLALIERRPQQQLEGIVEYCNTYPEVRGNDCWDGRAPIDGCEMVQGNITCSRLNDDPQVCRGAIQRCAINVDEDNEGQWAWDCVEIDHEAEGIRIQTSCWENEQYRRWSQLAFQVVDLRDVAQSSISDVVTTDPNRESTGVVVQDNAIYATWKQPADVEGDARRFVRYHFSRYDLTDPLAPVADDPVNIPGELIAVDGENLYTLDTVWGEEVVEAALNRLRLRNGQAELLARRRFSNTYVQRVTLDDAGHAVVSLRASGGGYWGYRGGGMIEDGVDVAVGNMAGRTFGVESDLDELAIIDITGDGLPVLAQVAVDRWATLQAVKANRALLTVPGGLLTMNLDDPENPYAQSYFPTMGWPQRFAVTGQKAYFAAGRYGAYAIDLDAFNLLDMIE